MGNHVLDYFRHRETFFDRYPILFDMAARGAGSVLISQDMAELFLNSFLSSLYYLVPFLDPDSLRRGLKQLYQSHNQHRTTHFRSVLLLAVLANGATVTTQSSWADTLYKMAKKEAAPLEEIISLEAVQLHLLFISSLVAFHSLQVS